MLNQRIKHYILYAVLIAAGWFVMTHHFIYNDKWFHLLKKAEPSLHYTFYSLDNRKAENVLKIDILRQDGIGTLLVELGKLDDEERMYLEQKYDMDAEME
ncbi:MAG: hypothetical protein HKM93_09285 [Desulfobacteraceae bacterium]|nr:hypothetical protein [Desulfobacteraceae bacterium]